MVRKNSKTERLFDMLFRTIQVKFSRMYVQILNRANVTLPQYVMLSELSSCGIVPMTQASRRLHITKPAVTHLVDQLEKRKYLKRISDPKDRRVHLLQIQSKGGALVRGVQLAMLEFLLKTLRRFTQPEKEVIVRFYQQLSQTVDEEMKKKCPCG